MILEQLGNEFSGSLSAQLSACQISMQDDEENMVTLYRHPALPEPVVVNW